MYMDLQVFPGKNMIKTGEFRLRRRSFKVAVYSFTTLEGRHLNKSCRHLYVLKVFDFFLITRLSCTCKSSFDSAREK